MKFIKCCFLITNTNFFPFCSLKHTLKTRNRHKTVKKLDEWWINVMSNVEMVNYDKQKLQITLKPYSAKA